MPVTIPATGSGTATPIISTDNVTADSSQVQNVQLVTVSGGVLTRTAANLPVNLTQLGGTTAVTGGVAGTLAVGGNVASDVAVTANPLGVGARASTAVPTAVAADGRNVNVWATRNGALVTVQADSTGVFDGSYAAPADDQSNAQTMGNVKNFPQLYDGTTWDRWRSTNALSTAPNVTTGIAAVGVGPGFDRKFNPSNLGTAVNSAITDTTDGADIVLYHIGTGTTGTFIFEVSADDTAWVTADITNAQTGVIQTANITPASGNVWRVATGGWRQVRIRTVTTLGATVAVKQTFHLGGAIPATWRELTNTRAADVAIVDGSGNQITSFGSPTKPTTGTQSNVAASASSVTVLASNANRLGASVTNDSTVVCYLLVGAGTASTTVHTVKLSPGAYYEVPFSYTGIIVGIWASATGSARVMEWT